ncbi:MAG: hypothetical protein Kow0062_00670 [Acidobacteriota bacterium]
MIETTALLEEYAALLRTSSGADAVSVALVPSRNDTRPLIVHSGAAPAHAAFASPESVIALEASWPDRDPDAPPAAPRLVAGHPSDTTLFRVPGATMLPSDAADSRSGPDRRTAGRSRRGAGAIWIALRGGAQRGSSADRAGVAVPEALLGFATVLAEHARSVGWLLEDPVTHLPTRAGLRTRLEIALEEAATGGHALALMLINPDGFAEVNTRFDRQTGDATLAEIATRLRSVVRATDGIARYGGATFGLLLPGADRAAAERLAHILRTALEGRPYRDGTLPLQFSIGVAVIPPDRERSPQDEVDEWIRRADEALFRAKLEGGSRHHVWSEKDAQQPEQTVDRLHGMFTGDFNTDYRHMAMLWEILQVVAEGGPPETLYGSVTQRLHTWLPARTIVFVEPAGTADSELRILAAVERGQPAPPDRALPEAARDVILAALRSRTPQHRPPSDVPESGGEACAIPLSVGDMPTGCIYFEAARGSRVGLPDPRFFSALAAQLAVALERARMEAAARERETRKRRQLEAEVRELRQAVHTDQTIWSSPAMREIRETIRRIAPTDATVLITGESGTGKEMIAREIHRRSARGSRPLVVVDCSAISPTLIDSELFGHEKGAFTGADARRHGRLAEADGGTLFLDEIGELPLDVQGRLLRFVQERQITPVGGTRPRTIDTRIIAATNLDLAGQVRRGRFREDLFNRLDVVRLQLPPLRERPEDVLELARLFVDRFASFYGKTELSLSPAAERALLAHAWPGNVRELQNRIMRAALFAEGPVLAPEHLALGGAMGPAAESGPPEDEPGDDPTDRDPWSDLRAAFAREVSLAMESGALGRPLGKWLEADLVLAAADGTQGAARPARELLGLADTTYRRRLSRARQAREAGLAVRSPTWSRVRRALRRVVAQPGDAAGALAARVERLAIEAIDAACGADARRGAALLGVSEPTYRKRTAGAVRVPVTT